MRQTGRQGRIGKGYEFRVICDECGFKRWSSEVAMRWDGFIVCRDTCWEPRNILDFYRTRNDAHLLPFTRPDTPSNGLSWTPTLSGSLVVNGTASIDATYTYDPIAKLLQYEIHLGGATSVVLSGVGTLSLPGSYTVATDHGGSLIQSRTGQFIGKLTASGSVISTPNVSRTIAYPDSLLFKGNLITN